MADPIDDIRIPSVNPTAVRRSALAIRQSTVNIADTIRDNLRAIALHVAKHGTTALVAELTAQGLDSGDIALIGDVYNAGRAWLVANAPSQVDESIPDWSEMPTDPPPEPEPDPE